MKLHLMMCRFCRRYIRQIRFIREVLELADEETGVSSESSTITLSSDARKRIKEGMDRK